MAKAWTKEEDELLLKLRGEGLSAREITRYIKRSKAAIQMRVQHLNAALINRPWSSQDKALAWQLKEQGHTNKYIGKVLKRTPAAIATFLARDEANHYSQTIPREK